MTEKLTVNELLSFTKMVRERLNELKKIRDGLTCETKYYETFSTGDSKIQKETILKYDVKVVDKKVTELENFLYRADAKIKTVNAKTIVDLEVDVDALLSPLE